MMTNFPPSLSAYGVIPMAAGRKGCCRKRRRLPCLERRGRLV